MKYQPKRSSARWLEGAPKPVLACYDNGGRTADRYTVLYGAPLWDESYGRNVPVRYMSENPFAPQGVGMFADMPAWNRAALGRKVRYADLPAQVRRCVALDCEETEQSQAVHFAHEGFGAECGMVYCPHTSTVSEVTCADCLALLAEGAQ